MQLYLLAVEQGFGKYGEEVEKEDLYRQVASELTQLPFFQNENEFPGCVANKLVELVPKIGF